MMRNVRVGDVVFHITRGPAEVVDVTDTTFKERTAQGRTTVVNKDGRAHRDDSRPTVYWAGPEYEHPPEPVRYKRVNGFDVPDIAEYQRRTGALWLANPYKEEWCQRVREDDLLPHIYCRLRREGLLYPDTMEGRGVAIAHAKAMLGVTP